MHYKYILKEHQPVPCNDMVEWGKWFKSADRHVAKTERDGVTVSTVFLGLDHNFCSTGDPILFETMVFGGPEDEYQERYTTWEEAEAGHKMACDRVFSRSEAP